MSKKELNRILEAQKRAEIAIKTFEETIVFIEKLIR